MNEHTQIKQEELELYIQQEIIEDTAVQGIVVIGSVAKGIARADSDIDAVVFLDPFDLYAVPAEAKWQPETGAFYSIFRDVPGAIQLDFHRVDLAQWQDPTYAWPESLCAELSEGWVAFDRNGDMQPLIIERTSYNDDIRQQRLDEAIIHYDWLLNIATTEKTWQNLGPAVAHHRLHSAYEYLVQGLFAYNRQWRTLKSREMADLVKLPWLPTQFESHLLLAMNALAADHAVYQQRVATLRQLFSALIVQCQQDGLYGQDAISEAFIRQNEEPGRAWNMDEWEQLHRQRLIANC